MKPGTIIKLSDGRKGTVVYNGLDGEGIIWGEKKLSPGEIEIIIGGCPCFEAPQYFPIELVPVAMLREKYTDEIECVGNDFEIIYQPEN